MTPSFWSGKRVFLTGHTGFKGSWMSLWLQQLGAELTGFALTPPTTPNLFEEARVAEGMHSVLGDIRDFDALKQSMMAAQPDIVIHMAAQPLVLYSYQNPVETYATNVMGTVHLLEAVRQVAGIRAVVNITTDKCYENREWVWGYRENEPMGGHDPYSNSKGCAELVTSAYRSSFFQAATDSSSSCAIASARAGNVIGGGDWASDRLIPDILRAFETRQTVQIRNPHATRPWQHVLEPLRGYCTLAERLYQQGAAYAEGWNFGPRAEDAQPVGWIVQHMAELWGPTAQWVVTENQPRQHEANSLKLDIAKARSRLGWNPSLDLTQALRLTVDWARQRQAGKDVRQTTLAQIAAYQTLNHG
ncbi:CDP-glucose 4,6-dehydratase [Leeia sp.]|uniref:CDP-glucose 4,6-dehydratase n=1 Tax=Leeia sp. TaxID=2884678 RepID=UPI0035B12D09